MKRKIKSEIFLDELDICDLKQMKKKKKKKAEKQITAYS